jgi:beta-lysine 5,6-aminomutase beta subunit
MSSGLYSTKKADFDTNLDLSRLKPYGDTMNDGKVQLSFALPVPDNEVAIEAARQFALKLGLEEPNVAYHEPLDKNYSFFIVYGSLSHTVDYTQIHVEAVDVDIMSMEETDLFIQQNFGRKIKVNGASTGTDAHTVGIDAILNMKGYAGHYGLERYKMIEAINLGSQVLNEDFIRKAVEFEADVLLVSQTVTQKNVHIQNLTELVELLEAEGLRKRFLLIIGGPRISHDLAKELGADAGFGPGKYADDVASFFCNELLARKPQNFRER